jgi:non-heme chloroperoxidase
MTGAAMAARANPGRATISTPTPTDLAELVKHLDLDDAIHVGHSTGGGEVARYNRPPRRQARRESRADRRDTAADAEDAGESQRHADRSVRSAARRSASRSRELLKRPEYAVLRLQQTGAKISRRRARSLWLRHDAASRAPISSRRSPKTDLTADCRKIDVPTLICTATTTRSCRSARPPCCPRKLIKRAELKVYPRAPHGMCTHKDKVNADLLAFIKA